MITVAAALASPVPADVRVMLPGPAEPEVEPEDVRAARVWIDVIAHWDEVVAQARADVALRC